MNETKSSLESQNVMCFQQISRIEKSEVIQICMHKCSIFSGMMYLPFHIEGAFDKGYLVNGHLNVA